MGFQQGLSGLNGASKNLDVIGNNIANVATVGFKASRVEFADVYANSLYGTGARQPGIGTQVAAISQQFNQGNIALTNNPLDIAINGNGFFVLDDNGSPVYSRNGQFQLDRNGYIVNSTGQRLIGLTGSRLGPPQNTAINNDPQATSEVSLAVNLDSRQTVPTAAFSYSPLAGYNHAATMTVYDSLGNAHMLNFYFRRTAPDTWDVYASVTNYAGVTTPLAPTPLGTLTFDPNGALESSTATSLTIPAAALATGANPIAITNLSFTGSTQSGSNFSIYAVNQNGNSYIVNNTGQRQIGLTGSLLGPIQITAINNDPQATSAVSLAVNLDSRQAVPTAAFSYSPLAGYNHATTMTVYDSLGNAHAINFYFRKTAPNTWDVYASVTNHAGVTTPLAFTHLGPAPLGTLTFDPNGALESSTATSLTIPPAALATGAYPIVITNLSFAGSTQFGSNFGIYAVNQNGYTTGQLVGLAIDEDGTIQGRYTNGQTQSLGQIVLTNFPNPQGLLPLGNNLWAETSASGQRINPQPPGSPNLGILRSGAVEESNVDLTQELVNLIIAQRLYQANAQTIRTQDQILQTLVNLR